MKTLLLLIMLLMPVIVYAESCPDIELKDMSQTSIENEYCIMLNIMKSSIKDWTMSTDDKTVKEIESCNKITDKMQRVYKERFNVDIPKCPEFKAKAKE